MSYITIDGNNTSEWKKDRYPHITEIRLINADEFDLRLMKKFPHLVELFCTDNIIKSLRPVRRLVNLQELYCNYNYIESLEPLGTLVNLQRLDCRKNNIKSLEPLGGLVNLQYLSCEHNNSDSLEPLRRLINLQHLSCNYNNIESLEPLSELVNLQWIFCGHNNIDSLEPVRRLVNLRVLHCGLNNIDSLEPISTLVQLHNLNFYHNRITSLNPIIYLRRLRYIDYDNNPLEPPTVQITRFVDRLREPSRSHNIYQDRQNVHNPHIQRSVMESVQSLLADPAPNNFTLETILHSSLSDHIKAALVGYCEDSTPHSIHLITYQELLSYVWQRILNSSDPEELFNILADEIADAECKCFTGRFNRTLSVLSGFYDDIQINISDRSRIGIIISLAKQDVEPYNAADHRARARERLLAAGYTEDEFEDWLEYIEE